MDTPTDAQLVQSLLAGDREAGQVLMGRHLDAAYRVARGICRNHDLADDAVQAGVERALVHLDRFDRRRPFAPWLLRIVANRAITLAERAGREPPREPDSIATAIGGGEEPATLGLLDALGGLPVPQRAVVVLRLAGFNPSETADMLDIPVGTVHSRLSRGLDGLADALRQPTDA